MGMTRITQYSRKGDTISAAGIFNGYVTNNAKTIAIGLTLPFPTIGVSDMTFTSFKCNVRQNGKYIHPAGSYVSDGQQFVGLSGWTVICEHVSGQNCQIRLEKTSAIANAVNNMECAIELNACAAKLK